MKKLKRIQAAEATSTEDKINESIGNLEDTFDYILSGLRYLNGQGAEAQQQALVIIEQLQSGLSEFTQRIADVIAE